MENKALFSVYIDQNDDLTKKKGRLAKLVGPLGIDIRDGGVRLPLDID
jgi:hypothetical protein